jgi:hypothetical protein
MEEPSWGIRQDEMANRAEQDRLRKCFREEEEKVNSARLLFGEEEFSRSLKKND